MIELSTGTQAFGCRADTLAQPRRADDLRLRTDQRLRASAGVLARGTLDAAVTMVATQMSREFISHPVMKQVTITLTLLTTSSRFLDSCCACHSKY